MPHRTFFWFIFPSLLAMLLFIALPIGSVIVQSVHQQHEQVLRTVENQGPFGTTTSTVVDQEATRALREAEPLGRFVGLDVYFDRAHLAVEEVGQAWAATDSIGAFVDRLMNLPFYRALIFTLTYVIVVTPLTILLGLAVALGVNGLPRMFKGPTIFVSLLPMMVTPLVGALVLYWMLEQNGILGSALQSLTGDPTLSLRASTPLTWITLFAYGVWSSAPFAFIVYYAGLQTVPQDPLEAAMVDGASRWQRIRYVVIPHLAPLTVFIALIQLMDNFRVLEPVISFNAGANAPSLAYSIYSDLRGEIALFNSAAATSMLTIIGVSILLTPVLIRTWRDFNAKRGH
ncbi:carbohydrate ABC transporter permease [Jannaschia aquimarina]|uniref:YcjO_2 protein n=1 Tax=Jannaschia aquimarina TaxID=935700 RepID=A0A0D1EDQ0_9RHOB|nr:sugar ABC transporter permease [Jannaschia aquimarina]KIT15081.1 Inner membrane ABC transporter permease protein YcjO [Jannaschia aquimarina]SNS63557.1 carbohydrate ABC transporter membrane protein 1, CUT1 family [Jannaschia aquimarina]